MGSNDKHSFKSCCNEDLKIAEISALFDQLLKNWQETDDKVQCLQRAIVVMSEGFHDFRAEYLEDIAVIKLQLHELRRNKVWIHRESI
jgi:hypothetical protein